MKKQDKIQDSPEFKQYKAGFENFVKGMEDDKEYADLKIPEGWEQDFARTMNDTLDGNERKRRNKIIKRIVGVAAAVVLVVAVGNLTAEQVSGENLLEMFMNRFTVGEREHDIYGTNNEIEIDEDNNEMYLYFDGTGLDDISKQIRNELKSPMFYLGYVPDGFTVKEAIYEKSYRIINIELVNEDSEHIYIFQQKQIDDTASGTMKEDIKESIVISNKKLNNQIAIYEGIHDNSWLFEVKVNTDLLTINTSIAKEECIKIAENIEYY